MSEELIERESMRFDEEYATFDIPFGYEDLMVMNGGEHFKLARYKDKIVLAKPNLDAKDEWNGKVFFEQTNLPVVIEMLTDVLDGKLREPETSRFAFKDDGFNYEDKGDDLRVSAQTVWANPQREPPEQVKFFNFRENKFSALGKQYGMSLNFTPQQAKGLLEQLKRIANKN
ncbi:MAG TPA: hypothetical protein VNI84_15680 [Pyrinomonadaceae bacterium]|nr:hypothetical protein [Pyrinomonadaceae bacterium]